jgi:hypothetical protein
MRRCRFGLLPSLTQQALVISVESSQFVLLDHQRLLELAQLNLNLLHLPFVPLLFLVSLFLDRIAVMLQCISRVEVLFFERADLLILLLHTNF